MLVAILFILVILLLAFGVFAFLNIVSNIREIGDQPEPKGNTKRILKRHPGIVFPEVGPHVSNTIEILK